MKQKKKILFLATAMLLGFLLRMYVYLFMMDHEALNGLMYSEPTGYINEAENIVHGGQWFMGMWGNHYQLLTMHPKGYSLLLALLMILFKSHYLTAAHILMIVLDTMVSLLIYQIIFQLFHHEKAGILDAFLWALNPLAIMNCNQDLPDAFSGILTAWILWLYYHPFHSKATKNILLGFSIAISVYFRAEYLLIIVLVFLSDWIQSRKLIASLKEWMICILSFLLIMSPWLIYSGIKSSHPMMASQTAWGSAYEAIGEDPDNSWNLKLGDQYVEEEAKENGFDSAWTYDANQYFKKKFLTYVKENPSEYLHIVVHYRLYKAFVPVSYAYFNLNRAGNGSTFRMSDYCNAQGSLKTLCTYSFTTAALLEKKGGRLMSWILLFCMILFLIFVIRKNKFRQTSFLFFVYLYFPLMISALKQIEPRNVFPSQVPLVIAAAVVINGIIQQMI